jgi:hypothetical protein
MRIADGDTSSVISMRSSACFAASSLAALAVFSAMTSTVFPFEGSTRILPLTLLISTRPPGESSYDLRHSDRADALRSAVTMSQPAVARTSTGIAMATATGAARLKPRVMAGISSVRNTPVDRAAFRCQYRVCPDSTRQQGQPGL